MQANLNVDHDHRLMTQQVYYWYNLFSYSIQNMKYIQQAFSIGFISAIVDKTPWVTYVI